MESLNRIKDLPIKHLFLGHFGISDVPEEVIKHSLNLMQSIMGIGKECMDKGKPEEIAPKFREFFIPKLENLRSVRGDKLYYYLKDELIASCSEVFSRYYQEVKIKELE